MPLKTPLSARVAWILPMVFIFLSLILGKLVATTSTYMPLLLVVGVSVLILALIRIDYALFLLIFSMLLSPELGAGTAGGRDITIRVEDILLAVITFAWLGRIAINNKLGVFAKTPLNKPIAFYSLICVLSTSIGIITGRVDVLKGTFFVLKYIEYFLLYFMVVNTINSKKQIKMYLTALFITCFLVSIYGMSQIGTGRVSAPFEGEVGEPNTLGGYMIFIMALTLGLLVYIKSKRIKYSLLALIASIVPPFLFTLSRASYVALFPMYFSIIWFGKVKSKLVLVFIVIVLLGLFFVPKEVKKRIEYTFKPQREAQVKIGNITLGPSTSARIISWKTGIEDWKNHPILGYGTTGYAFIDGQYFKTLIESGILGLIGLIWIIIAAIKNALRNLKQQSEPLYKGLCLGFLAGAVCLSAHALGANTFIIIRIMEPFWFVAGMVMALPYLKGENIAA
ncbi:O-antigen ligase family protein [bacterium]|nr:O-antigen ligase family protein [bacterium]